MTKTERLVQYTAAEIDAMLARGEDRTDWERLRKLTDEEVEASIDFEEEGEFDWDTARVSTSPPQPDQHRWHFGAGPVSPIRQLAPDRPKIAQLP